MKKRLIIAISLLLIIIASTPWVVGYQCKQHYLALINTINKTYAPTGFIKVDSYKLGWLHSTATYTVTLPGNASILSIKGTSLISHGPIVFDHTNNSVAFGLAAIKETMAFTLPNTQGQAVIKIPTLTSNSVMDFGNTITSTLNMQAMTIEGVTWDGLTGTSILTIADDQLKSVLFKLTVGAIHTKNANDTQNNQNLSLNIAPITMTCEHAESSQALMTQRCDIALSSASLTTPSKETSVSLKGLSLIKSASLNLLNKAVTYNLDLKMNTLASPQFVVPELTAIHGTFAVNNINMNDALEYPSTAALQKTLNVIQPDSTVALTLSFNAALGAFNIDGALDWKGLATLKNPTMDDIQKLTRGTGNFKASMPLTQKLAQLVVWFAPDYFAQIKQQATLNDSQLLTSNNAKEQFDKEIAQLVQQNKIDLPSAIAIMNTHETQPSIDTFKAEVNAFQITDDVKKAIIAAEEKSTQLAEAAKEIPLTTDQMVMLLINDWLQNGYIIQKDNDYISSATINAGIFQLNGRRIN